jgi:hypothetical protein
MLRHHAPDDCCCMSGVVRAHRGQRRSHPLWGTWPAHARERGSHRIAFAVVRFEMLDKGDIISCARRSPSRGNTLPWPSRATITPRPFCLSCGPVYEQVNAVTRRLRRWKSVICRNLGKGRRAAGPRACLTFHHAGNTIFIVTFLATPYQRHRLSQTTRQHNADIAKTPPCRCSARLPR